MLERLSDFVSRARTKAAIELSFAAHSAGRWFAQRTARVATEGDAKTAAASFHRLGYVSIPPDQRMRAFVQTQYAEMERDWTARTGTWRDPPTGGTYKIFLSNICERWPEVLRLLDGSVGDVLRAYYGSHFQYTYVEPYRTLPSEGELPKSWLWHRDGVPPGFLKVMVYLNGATGDTGALRVVSRDDSHAIDRLGFGSRADSDRLATEFEKRHHVLDGEPGTAVIIDNTVLHKATAPSHNFRDVVCFQVVPSSVPEDRARSTRSRSYASDTPQYPFFPPLHWPR